VAFDFLYALSLYGTTSVRIILTLCFIDYIDRSIYSSWQKGGVVDQIDADDDEFRLVGSLALSSRFCLSIGELSAKARRLSDSAATTASW
jgi:hypothetical protein